MYGVGGRQNPETEVVYYSTLQIFPGLDTPNSSKAVGLEHNLADPLRHFDFINHSHTTETETDLSDVIRINAYLEDY